MRMDKEKVTAIALAYIEKTKSPYYSLEFLFAKESVVMNKYWDIGFRVLNEDGNEIDGPLLMAVDDETGTVLTMDEVITKNINNPDFKMTTEPLNRNK